MKDILFNTDKVNLTRPIFGGLNSVAESVTPGHPDKTCDQIANRYLDEALKISPDSRVAIEMVACDGKIIIGGEVSPWLKKEIKVEKIVKDVFKFLGYTEDIIEVNDIINTQSVDIAEGVDREDKKLGAGDQGIMCGYAIYSPGSEHLPAAFFYSKSLSRKLFEVSMNKVIPSLRADGKTQVIIIDGKIEQVTIAIQHDNSWLNNKDLLNEKIIEHVIKPVAGKVPKIVINGAGNFVKGSIWADAGEVGRKIVIDQMGPDIPVGGGSLCGKDPSKVDLTGALMARYIAKNMVANKLANEALVQIAFTIGQPEPDTINIFAPGWRLDIDPVDWVKKNFKLSVRDMINQLALTKPNGWSYEEAARFGFYGNTKFPWEKILIY